MELNTLDALLASYKFLSTKIEIISKKLEAMDLAQLSSNVLKGEFCKKVHISGTCLPTSLRLSDEHVRYMESYAEQ